MSIPFEILIDDSFINISIDKNLKPIDKKFVLSIANDFESNKWRYNKFRDFVWDNVAETALSLKERKSLVDMSKLSSAAKKLRLVECDNNEGSELAEILLYGIMKHHYNALSVVPKIFYKQNVNDYVKGADSIHIVIENKTDFSLWFGEAKFYSSIENSRLDQVVLSIENTLSTEKLKKENTIITNITDLKEIDELKNNKELLDRIMKLLSQDTSIDILKPKLHIPILLLHECQITKNATELNLEYRSNIVSFHKERANEYYKKQIDKLSSKIAHYEKIYFHIILFPVPDKKQIVDSFVKMAKTIRGDLSE